MTTVINTKTFTFYPWYLGPHPTPVICPKCKSPIISKVDFETESLGCGLSILMCILATILVCIIFPPITLCCFYSICYPSKKQLTHRCPKCQINIGIAIDYRPELRNKSIIGNQALVNEIQQTKINILAQIPENKLRNITRTVRPQDRNASKESGTLEAIRIAKPEKEQNPRTNQEIILKVEEDKNDSKMTSNHKEGNLNNEHTNAKNIQIQIKEENDENEENIKLLVFDIFGLDL